MIRSAFLYGYTVTDETKNFYFDEGAGVQSFIIPPRSYSLENLRELLQTLLIENGTQVYTVAVNRVTRLFTISAPLTFDLLPSTTTENFFSVIGITADKLAGITYESDISTGQTYLPQFALEGYGAFGLNKKSIKGSVSEAPSGITQATDFGTRSVMKCDFPFIGNFEHRKDSPVESNANGLQDAIDFFDYAITKGEMEFMYDRTDFNTYNICILESAGSDRNGLGYELKEIKNLPSFYQIKKLIFREL